MAKARSKPFERFGTYVLFKKIDSDSFGELWRVGAIENGQIGQLLALRKLTGATQVVAGAVSAASPLVKEYEGAALVRNQQYGVIDGEPFITWEYGGGRSLRHIIDRAREAGHAPLPTDQALAIAEKVATAVEFVSTVKVEGRRILHGALIPQLVWIYDDGDVRTAGQYLNAGLLASLSDPAVASEIGPYVAPEIRKGGTPTRASDVYSIGAILYLVVTGQEPPDSADLGATLTNVTLMQSGEPLPDDIRKVIETAMHADPAARYTSPAEAKEAISEILAGSNYAPTTFNLAFYLHNLLRKEMEGESVEREKESKVNPEPYLEEIAEEKAAAAAPTPAGPAPTPAPAAAPQEPQAPQPPEPVSSAPTFGTSLTDKPSGSRKGPLVAAIFFIVAAGAAGVWYMTQGKSAEPATQVAQTEPAATEPSTTTVEESPLEEIPLEEPVVTEIPGAEEEAPADAAAAAKQKAMEDEVNRRVQEEMRKLQDEYNRQIKQQQAATAAAESTDPPPAATSPKPAAAETPKPAETAPPKAATTTMASAEKPPEPVAPEPAAPATATVAEQVTPPPPPAPPAVKEGDLVVSSELDSVPKILKRADPAYPPIAAKQKISSLVIVSALVDEKGKVIDAKVLRGDSRNLGFDEASLKAIRRFTFQPATKDGKKVKTWYSVPFIFGKQQ